MKSKTKEFKTNLNKMEEKMTSERTTNLKQYYKYEYTCKKCKRKYGSDEKEKEKDKICPNCLCGQK